MSLTIKNAISAALNNPEPARNFVTGQDAKNIAAAAKADGKVTAEEIKAVTDLNLGPTFFDDDLFGGRDFDFAKPTASGNGYGQLQQFLQENSLKHAVDHALHGQGFLGFNFVDSQDARNIIGAAKADGRIDATERQQLEDLRMGWTYHSDSDGKTAQPFEKPTLSMGAGQLINRALRDLE